MLTALIWSKDQLFLLMLRRLLKPHTLSRDSAHKSQKVPPNPGKIDPALVASSDGFTNLERNHARRLG